MSYYFSLVNFWKRKQQGRYLILSIYLDFRKTFDFDMLLCVNDLFSRACILMILNALDAEVHPALNLISFALKSEDSYVAAGKVRVDKEHYFIQHININLKILKIEIEIAKKSKETRRASIPTCELKHLKLSHMDLYSDSINLT